MKFLLLHRTIAWFCTWAWTFRLPVWHAQFCYIGVLFWSNASSYYVLNWWSIFTEPNSSISRKTEAEELFTDKCAYGKWDLLVFPYLLSILLFYYFVCGELSLGFSWLLDSSSCFPLTILYSVWGLDGHLHIWYIWRNSGKVRFLHFLWLIQKSSLTIVNS